MDAHTTEVFLKKQRKNFADAILSLYCTTLYARLDSACALDGEIDNLIYELEVLYNSTYNKKRVKHDK